MRIVAGQFRGRPLKAPKGEATRPTTDRVRESMMSAVESARGGLEGAVVLDAFAGSGALGLEALSRGARCAHFFERSGEALRALCANVRSLGLDARRARLHRADVLKDPPVWASEPFDLVFLDPPYACPARSRSAGRSRQMRSWCTSMRPRRARTRTRRSMRAVWPLRGARSTGILSWTSCAQPRRTTPIDERRNGNLP